MLSLFADHVDLILVLAAVGGVSGLLAGLFGVGGGIITVPTLFIIYPQLGIPPEMAMHLAIGTSLALIVPTGLSSARSHHRRGGVDMTVVKRLAPATVVGAALGGFVATFFKSSWLSLLFGCFAIMIGIFMLRGSKGLALVKQLPDGGKKHALGGTVGLLSAMLGVGGGTLNVPTLLACGYPMAVAVGTGAALGLAISVPGTISFMLAGWGQSGLPLYSIGYVHLLSVLLMAPLSILCAPLGARLAHKLPAIVLRRSFAVMLLLIAGRMIYKSL